MKALWAFIPQARDGFGKAAPNYPSSNQRGFSYSDGFRRAEALPYIMKALRALLPQARDGFGKTAPYLSLPILTGEGQPLFSDLERRPSSIPPQITAFKFWRGYANISLPKSPFFDLGREGRGNFYEL
jgi:hypothetical protein